MNIAIAKESTIGTLGPKGRFYRFYTSLICQPDVCIVVAGLDVALYKIAVIIILLWDIISSFHEQEPRLILVYFEFLIDKPVWIDADKTFLIPQIQTLGVKPIIS